MSYSTDCNPTRLSLSLVYYTGRVPCTQVVYSYRAQSDDKESTIPMTEGKKD